ncbi:hypothetical protein LV457_11650 [Mycobacterium sp. MYCO198283]|uniref:hypothetical protein n=1 Tax=Mycobacterium sp. MYCO198283 TaxID=2883505 RepID=UPI001E5A9A16|nr:hypothetical protein [Mycobacterium sp. MYCO198283]MCG5432937.1 hypothetical protein [Mycobacterium sp. MYCO198283]
MGIWREAFRPHCHGLFVENGTLFAQRYVSDPQFRLLDTPEERRAYLAPIPIPLDNARVFLDIGVGEPGQPELPADRTLHVPAHRPRSRGRKHYTITVYVGDSDVYVGYPAGGGEARNMFWAIEKLVKAHGTRR